MKTVMLYSLCIVNRKEQVTNMNDCVKGPIVSSVITDLQMQIGRRVGRPQVSPVSLLLTVGRCKAEVYTAWIQCAPGAQETSDEDASTVQQAHVAVCSTQRSDPAFAVLPVWKQRILSTFHRRKLSLKSSSG